MKTEGNIGFVHNTFMASPSIDPFSSALYPFPNLLGDSDFYNYETYSGISKQSNQTHYIDQQTQLANVPTQTILSHINHPLLYQHQTSTGKISNPNFGITQVNSGFSMLTDSHSKHSPSEGILKTSITGVDSSENRVLSGAVSSSSKDGRATSGKLRIRWTHELHEHFVDAVNSLGGPTKATPKGILIQMRTPGLTIFHIKSHLQTYRTAKGVPSSLEGSRKSNCAGLPQSNLKGNVGFQISETLRLQLDVQKSLHEHLEFQRKLQMRIQDHANHLQQVIDRQRQSCSYLHKHSSNEVNNPFNGEHSPTSVHKYHGEFTLNK